MSLWDLDRGTGPDRVWKGLWKAIPSYKVEVEAIQVFVVFFFFNKGASHSPESLPWAGISEQPIPWTWPPHSQVLAVPKGSATQHHRDTLADLRDIHCATWNRLLAPCLCSLTRVSSMWMAHLQCNRWRCGVSSYCYFFNRLYLFRAVLGSEQTWGEGPEISDTLLPHTLITLPLSASPPEWYLCYNWWHMVYTV